ncbi:glycosyltransferase family 2 protein [Afifella pfennigii]|uniref:glycosyltransferase family 2 protein n=1 Tax=Afifella pfennigii TaxID=209897 RepID=UPI00068FD7F5|nr:glycosyltransferase family 2 protein [Afifella pfennigii]
MTHLSASEGLRVAVLLPCRNEAATIEKVVRGFREALPEARIYVFDEASTDDTARIAGKAGAKVLRGAGPDRGAALWRMFADIEADIYLMASGDGACEPADASSLINALVTERLDMVIGTSARLGGAKAEGASWAGGGFAEAYRRLFGAGFSDPFGERASPYRALTRRLVKSFPPVAPRLSPETALTLHASELSIPVASLSLDGGRPAPRHRKERSLARLGGEAATLARIMLEARPLALFATFGAIFGLIGVLIALPLLAAALGGSPAGAGATMTAMSALLLAAFALATGFVLESLRRARLEQKRILFLSVPALGVQ